MKKSINDIAKIFLILMFTASPLTAADDILEKCTEETFLAYFPEPIVNEVLKGYQVPDQLWSQINEDLQSQDVEVIKIVEEKASGMTPHPLEDPSQKEAAIAIFRETLFEVFSKVMNDYGISDEDQIRAMLDEIQYKKGKLFKQCMEKESDTLDITPPEAEEIEVQEESEREF